MKKIIQILTFCSFLFVNNCSYDVETDNMAEIVLLIELVRNIELAESNANSSSKD